MSRKIIQLHPDDNVGIALVDLAPAEYITCGGTTVAVSDFIRFGHKVALKNLTTGQKIVRNQMAIGSATQPISAGEHVHLHNLKSDYIATLNQYYAGRNLFI